MSELEQFQDESIHTFLVQFDFDGKTEILKNL